MTDDPYTMSMRLCDDDGMVSDAAAPRPGRDSTETYLQRLNRLRDMTAWLRGDGRVDDVVEPFTCTGSAHLAGEHIRCTSPAHQRTGGLLGVNTVAVGGSITPENIERAIASALRQPTPALVPVPTPGYWTFVPFRPDPRTMIVNWPPIA